MDTPRNIIPFRRKEAVIAPTGEAVRDDAYRLHLIGSGKTDDTVRTYLGHLNRYSAWCKEHVIEPILAEQADVLRHVAETIENYSRSTANTRISMLKSFYRWTITKEYRVDDPSRDLHLRKEVVEGPSLITKAQLQRLVAVAETLEEQSVFLMFIGSGIRRKELLQVRVEDIDFITGTVLVHGKGLRQRTVLPGRTAMKSLRAHIGERTTGRAWDLSKSKVKRLLDRLAKRAGIESSVYPHRLRVAWECELFEDKVDAIAIPSLAGHSLEQAMHYQKRVEKRRSIREARRFNYGDKLGKGIVGITRLSRLPEGRVEVAVRDAELATEIAHRVSTYRAGRRVKRGALVDRRSA